MRGGSSTEYYLQVKNSWGTRKNAYGYMLLPVKIFPEFNIYSVFYTIDTLQKFNLYNEKHPNLPTDKSTQLHDDYVKASYLLALDGDGMELDEHTRINFGALCRDDLKLSELKDIGNVSFELSYSYLYDRKFPQLNVPQLNHDINSFSCILL